MKESLRRYVEYHLKSQKVGDIDPQNPALKYICNRFDLNMEQRYWIAFLFGCSYCAPTTYYIYNEFPDFENVNLDRLEKWWSENKNKCVFQTDRLRIKTQDKLCETFSSYKNLIGKGTQEQFFNNNLSRSPREAYSQTWEKAKNIKNFGRFSLFIYIELLFQLCKMPIEPERLDVANAKSCFNGMCYALGYENFLDRKISKEQAHFFEKKFQQLCKFIRKQPEGGKEDHAWAVETSLCAYKKHVKGKRWVGYYIDRQHDEILKMEKSVTEGVCWKPFWDFRKEFYGHKNLCELTNKKSSLHSPYAESKKEVELCL